MLNHRITHSPLPKLLDLIRILFDYGVQDSNLLHLWKGSYDFSFWFFRSAWSLYVIAIWRKQLSKREKLTFWVPDYFCNESLFLLRKLNVRFFFYPVDENGCPSTTKISEIALEDKPDIFLLVHYFGQPAASEEAVAICKASGAWLVEDAAHVLRPIPGVGQCGDCVIYSPHKHIAIPDGALMLIRKEGPAGLEEGSVKILDGIVANLKREHNKFSLHSIIWLLKRILQKFGIRNKNIFLSFSRDALPAETFTFPFEMSFLAKRLMKYEQMRINEIEKCREEFTKNWKSVIENMSASAEGSLVPANFSRYLAGFSFSDKASAEKVYTDLNRSGLPALTWPDLSPEVTCDPENFKLACHLRLTRLYLPIHRDVNFRSIGASLKKIRKTILARWEIKRIESQEIWESYWLNCPNKNLTQTWEYGSSKADAESWNVVRFLVLEDGVPTALFQVLVKKIPVFGIGVARINRGPLMLRGEGNFKNRLALNALMVMTRESFRRRWWMLQVAPELPPDNEIETQLYQMGFRKRLNYPADSAILSLTDDEDKLLMKLDGKWRNCLRKGQKLQVKIHTDIGANRHLDLLLQLYKEQQMSKGFDGMSEQMLIALVNNQSTSFRFNLFLASDSEIISATSILGALVTLQFGNTSEYLIGITNEKGRIAQANSVLLWDAIIHAKQNGSIRFDLGGLAENTPKGIANFKRGLNAESYHLTGEWRKWF
ncbi:peptidoglycan bridge formation glycyltransferase FemA/FemB family protein [Leptospira brenneri]|uniref:peptidoglycan bridge formation glycyltransferase FemA/FemB family protein n=1 Tax=Leptospira brenneri TaxID=2023182 RepID=UPI000C2A7480|nr:peptidoglycan bridge formation glycyltransferase FemA/FemB family protein [Leptospira brenneri]PJZ45505.1 hypothetical protein CH361_10795 [Leptospira brenneri]